ncbi:hypothetical protein [Aurantiacibacter poecillastricola]|uniref:hypothetical protein n=1 Tax=Aurantiacibacter poecillastricola TaxID=3064385 RepID=UPI00273EBDD7|nr:hypothetical protein [Aurantiacibacter sp. 219JJ12-13]MDP5262985.1 hypothetical protein [Aurantiacibacter sp. 219JJ12-13]
MFDRNFFSSQLGQAALVSIAAMLAFTIFAGMEPVANAPAMVVGMPLVELA